MAQVNLIVARAHIAGGVELELEAPPEIVASAGDVLQIKFPYRFDEVSARRENFTIDAEISVDGGPPSKGSVSGKDRIAMRDDKRGVILLEHALSAAGQHRLAFKVAVEVELADWDGGEASVQREELAGNVIVNVS